MDQPEKSRVPAGGAAERPGPSSDLAVDEFFNQLQSDMRRPDLSQDAIAAAFQAIQKLATESGPEEAAQMAATGKIAAGTKACPACHTQNREGSRFCGTCGVPLQEVAEKPAPDADVVPRMQPAGAHHYHHHYHHFLAPANGAPQSSSQDFRSSVPSVTSRDALKPRVASATATPNRSESAVRRMTQDWAHACNTKQLDDLVEFYATDALIMRSNIPPLRGTAAIREFLFAALDAGLGEAEFDPVRVEIFGDVAFEAGRFKTLVPIVVGKRREERGKYLILFVRQPGGDWKAIVDCWSSDLNLGMAGDSALKPGAQSPSTPPIRPVRKI